MPIGPRKQDLYFKLPFLDDKTNEFLKSEINKIFNRYFPQIKPIPVFFNNHKIKNYTNHKERLPLSFESLVVYKFECPSCQLAYIGSTKKTLHSRYFEHRGFSCRTNRALAKPIFSSIRDHCMDDCKCVFNINDFNIIYKGCAELEIRCAESLLIRKIKPSLNIDNSSFPLSLS